MSYGKRINWLKNQKSIKNNPNIQQAKKIVLFDMDGTLTDPRKPFDVRLMPSLLKITEKANIGIVTGSDMDYVDQQLKYLLDSNLKPYIHILPCNGTKYYKPPSFQDAPYELSDSVNMKDHLGDENFKQIMLSLINQLSVIGLPGISLTGHFISYRGSMINFCPIGRNADSKVRKQFSKFDKSTSPTYREIIRKRIIQRFSVRGVSHLVQVKLGGSTSFDIHPNGWDKTFCLKHFEGIDAWFVGDKCQENGNDKELYDILKNQGKSFETKSTENTRLIIENDIIPKL